MPALVACLPASARTGSPRTTFSLRSNLFNFTNCPDLDLTWHWRSAERARS